MTTKTFWKTHLWDNLGFADLDIEEYTRRTTAVQLGFFTAISGVIYSLIYVWLGFPAMALSATIYVALFSLALIYLTLTRNFNVYKYVQLGLILLAPLANHIIVGGFVESSIVILASFITPVIALTFVTRKTAQLFFYLFIVVVLVGGAWDLLRVAPILRLPPAVITLFFTSNIITICVIIYLLIDSFLKKQEELRTELRQSLDALRTTQTQLIQSEKMASLGELTAGIAHEIQNPLNFVNNFSDVSVELLDELREEQDETIRDELLTDLRQNLHKISHHGGRASSIVKGMLEHSRTSTGQRVLTDLNALADEYLRLAYHGLRAKDKGFNCELKTGFDQQMPRIKTVPQDVGRVLLNLFTNAFYAVQQRQKRTASNQQVGSPGGLKDYQPIVTVSTRFISQPDHPNVEPSNRPEGDTSLARPTGLGAGVIEVRVIDNGIGIPDAVKAKIFQPFFTTKPTGEGTGLGLSLAYDIITKGHSGTLEVESREGEGTTFIIKLSA